jgi:hypothetical protein
VGDENGKSLLPIISLIRKELLHLGFPKSSAHPQADSARLAKVGDENGKSLLPKLSLIRKELLHLGFPKSSAHPQADSALLTKVGEKNSKFLLLLMTRNSNQCLFRIAPKALNTAKLIPHALPRSRREW